MKVQTGVEYLGLALRYLSAASKDVTSENIREAIEATKNDPGDDIMPTIVEEWIEKGIETGRIEAQRENILDLLLIRFDAAPRHLTEKISALENLNLLRALHRQAATAESLSAFESYLSDALQ